MSYKYELQKYKTGSKVDCPSCGQKKRFTLYIDTETGQPLHRTVGICDRESNCGYHYTPKQYFVDIGQKMPKQHTFVAAKPTPPKVPDFLPYGLVEKSQSTQSNFVSFLSTLFVDGAIVQSLCQRYKLGVTEQREVIFWQVDEQSKVRSGKIMQYNPTNGKRSKTQTTDWVHARMIKAKKLNDFNLIQCFFGQHLLIDKTKTIAIVESEKTAIICSGLMPNFIWLAAGSLHGLNIEKCKCLKGRNVILFPDLSKQQTNRMAAFAVWSAKAIEISRAHGCKVIVSDLLERNASEAERAQGLDIADYLTNMQVPTVEPPKVEQAPKTKNAFNLCNMNTPNIIEPIEFIDIVPLVQKQKSNWSKDIAELETYFASAKLPSTPIVVNSYTKVIDSTLFIKSHLSTLRANNGTDIIKPHLERLQGFKQIISDRTNKAY